MIQNCEQSVCERSNDLECQLLYAWDITNTDLITLSWNKAVALQIFRLLWNTDLAVLIMIDEHE